MSEQDISSSVYVVGNEEAENILRSPLEKLGLRIVTREMAAFWTGEGAPFADRVIDEAFEHARAAIVLFSGDEQVRLCERLWKKNERSHERDFLPQPTLDRIFEAGYAFGRFPKRTILLRMGQLRPFSDTDGRYIVNFAGTEPELPHLISRLKSVECRLTIKSDLLSSLGISSQFDDSYIQGQNGASQNSDGATAKSVNPKSVFVVHGRNRHVQDSVFGFLESIGLMPIDWEEAVWSTKVGAPYVGEVLETLLRKAQAVLVLLTGDDEKLKRDDAVNEHEPFLQLRPNVVFEAGMAFGDRWLKDRTILLEVGAVEICQTLIQHRFTHKNDSKHYEDLIGQLEHVGCEVEVTNRDLARRMWMYISKYY